MRFPPAPPVGNISGIYNYCFRWCERCPFTNRCGNYQLAEELEDGRPKKAVARVFNRIPVLFTEVLSSLERSCEAADFEWSEIKLQVDGDEVHPTDLSLRELDQVARQFTLALLGWLGEYRQEGSTESWQESRSLLEWYGTLLSSKTHRAVSALEEPWPDMPPDNSAEGITSDGNGSAKIALLAIARCLAALSVMLENPGPYEEELLTFTLDLLRLQQALRFFYPYVNAFERVAFDDEDYQDELEAYYADHLPIDPFRDGPWTAQGSRAPQEEERR